MCNLRTFAYQIFVPNVENQKNFVTNYSLPPVAVVVVHFLLRIDTYILLLENKLFIQDLLFIIGNNQRLHRTTIHFAQLYNFGLHLGIDFG